MLIISIIPRIDVSEKVLFAKRCGNRLWLKIITRCDDIFFNRFYLGIFFL